jgi:hypothetical protein
MTATAKIGIDQARFRTRNCLPQEAIDYSLSVRKLGEPSGFENPQPPTTIAPCTIAQNIIVESSGGPKPIVLRKLRKRSASPFPLVLR